MKYSFNQYLAKRLAEEFVQQLQEENLLSILVALKKKLDAMLKEDVEIDAAKTQKYLKIVAMFEQLFRHLSANKIEPTEVMGFKTLLNKNDIDQADEKAVEKGIEGIMHVYDNHHMINFKRIVERRYDDFKKWIVGKSREDLEIVQNAIEYTLKSIEKFNQDAVHA